MPRRRGFRSLLGGLLVAYGLVGAILAANGLSLLVDNAGSVGTLASTLDDQRTVLANSLTATSAFVRQVESATADVRTSLNGAIDAAHRTAGVAVAFGSTMNDLSAASGLSVLGTRPFGGLSDAFGSVARQAADLGTAMDTTANDLATNANDVQAIHDDLVALDRQIVALQADIAAPGGLDDARRTLETAGTILFGLLVWLGAQALAAIVAGCYLVWTALGSRGRTTPGGPRSRASTGDGSGEPGV